MIIMKNKIPQIGDLVTGAQNGANPEHGIIDHIRTKKHDNTNFQYPYCIAHRERAAYYSIEEIRIVINNDMINDMLEI